MKSFLEKEMGIKISKDCKKEDIAKKAWEKIEEIGKRIEGLLYPDSSPAEMFEAENISKATRKELAKSYRIINKIKNMYGIARITNNKKEYEEFFKELKNEWKNIKDPCIKAFREAINAWKKEFREEKESYFG